MSINEYDSLFEKLLSNRDDLDTLDTIRKSISTDVTNLESVSKQNTEYSNKIRELQDTNAKLYLSTIQGRKTNDTKATGEDEEVEYNPRSSFKEKFKQRFYSE